MISEQEQKRIVAEMLNKALERKENGERLRRLADKEVKPVVLITNENQYNNLLKEFNDGLAQARRAMDELNGFELEMDILGEVVRVNTPNIKVDIKVDLE